MGQGARAFVLKAQQKCTFSNEIYRDSSLLVTSCLGFLVVMVVCGNGGCQAPTTTANYLACSRLLALYKRYPRAREWGKASQKSGRLSYSGSMTFPWLAGTPRDLWVGGNLF